MNQLSPYDRFISKHPDAYRLFVATVHNMVQLQPGCRFGSIMVASLLDSDYFNTGETIHIPMNIARAMAQRAVANGDLPATVFNFRTGRKRS